MLLTVDHHPPQVRKCCHRLRQVRCADSVLHHHVLLLEQAIVFQFTQSCLGAIARCRELMIADGQRPDSRTKHRVASNFDEILEADFVKNYVTPLEAAFGQHWQSDIVESSTGQSQVPQAFCVGRSPNFEVNFSGKFQDWCHDSFPVTET